VNSTLDNIAPWIEAVRRTPFCNREFLVKINKLKNIYLVDELPSIDVNEGPSQKEIDFNKQMNDEQLLNEYRMIHDESEQINEHGIGIY
jgi:hypothetical protein